MGDYYQSPEPGWKRDIEDLRKEVRLSIRIVIWAFSISWVAIVAMYAAGFIYYLPAQLAPLTVKLDKIDGDLKDGLKSVNAPLLDLTEKVGKLEGRAQPSPPPVNKAPAKAKPIASTPKVTPDAKQVCEFPQLQHLDFGEVNVGDQKTFRLSLGNSSNSPLTLNKFQVGGPARASFAVANNNCREALSGGGACTVDIIFAPQEVGSLQATLSLNCSSPTTTNELPANLVGVGK